MSPLRRLLSAALVLLTWPVLGAVNSNAGAHRLEPNSKVYIEPMNGFETDLSAAIVKKHVPVVLVDAAKNADFIITGTSEVVKANWAKTVFITPASAVHASIAVKDPSSGQIIYAYAWDKYAASKGAQSAAEGVAKHLKAFIEEK